MSGHTAAVKTPVKEHSIELLGKIGAAILLLCSLAFLVGCQGVSAGGTGQAPLGTLSLSNVSLDFGNVAAGSSKTLTLTATNSGSASITISAASISTKSFSLTSPALPLSIAAGQSAKLSFSFSPNAAGTFSATVTITSDASNTSASVSLAGTGTASGQLELNPSNESFGNYTVGTSKSMVVTLTNGSTSSINISQISIGGSTAFQLSGVAAPLTLNASASTTFTVTFAPQTAGAVQSTVTISSNGPNPTLTMALSGTGVAANGALTSNPSSLNFGSVTVGNTQSISETITNSGGASITVSQVASSGTGFSLTGITAPITLNGGQSASFTVSFAPTSSGSMSGSITITSTATNPTLTIPLSGTGVAGAGQLSVTPTTLNLGSVTVGSSGTATGTLTASGANVTVTAASANNSVFSVGGLSLPVTIAAGRSTSFTVTFSPQVSGTASATLTFTSNAQPSTTPETLTGTGTAASTHTVSLTWNASTSTNISGYNVYRAVYNNSCGSYGKINSVLNTGTLYTDSGVVNGSSYCYATTAVNTSNEESSYSNVVSNVQIP